MEDVWYGGCTISDRCRVMERRLEVCHRILLRSKHQGHMRFRNIGQRKSGTCEPCVVQSIVKSKTSRTHEIYPFNKGSVSKIKLVSIFFKVETFEKHKFSEFNSSLQFSSKMIEWLIALCRRIAATVAQISNLHFRLSARIFQKGTFWFFKNNQGENGSFRNPVLSLIILPNLFGNFVTMYLMTYL